METGQYGTSGPPAQKFLTPKWLPPKEGQEHVQIPHQHIGEELAKEMTVN